MGSARRPRRDDRIPSFVPFTSLTIMSIRLRSRTAGDPKIADDEEAEAAHLDVVPSMSVAEDHAGGGASAQSNDVVGHQAVPALHELDSALALADAALAEQESLIPKTSTRTPCNDVDGTSFSSRSAWSALMDRLDRASLAKSGVPSPPPPWMIARGRSLRLVTTTHDSPSEKKPREDSPRCSVRERLEERELGLAEHLHARRDDAVVVTRQRQPALLHARDAGSGGRGRSPANRASLMPSLTSSTISRTPMSAIGAAPIAPADPRCPRHAHRSLGRSAGRKVDASSERISSKTAAGSADVMRRWRKSLLRRSCDAGERLRCAGSFGVMTPNRMVTGASSMA